MKRRFQFIFKTLAFTLVLLITLSSTAQNIGINESGDLPDNSALLDLSSTKKGLLVPRLTTVQRDAIPGTKPESLLIYNTTTRCFEAWDAITSSWNSFGCMACNPPSVVTATASPNPICEGTDLTLTGGATDATSWSWSGPNGYSSSSQSPTITNITSADAGVYTLTATNSCGSESANTVAITVNEEPTVATAGSDINPICGTITATLSGNTPTVGTGIWTVVSGQATITNPSSPTSSVTGLAIDGTVVLRWTVSNSPCTASSDDVVITTSNCCRDTETILADVTNSTTGKIWMDRNLGATQVATSSTDSDAYGDLYQWGRCKDGHEKRNSLTIPTLSSTNTPGHNRFITPSDPPSDWRTTQNDNLWQGLHGVNNPCPSGYRLPTKAELDEERLSWLSNNAAGAFGSSLKLTMAGIRNTAGDLESVNYNGRYWSSTVNGINADDLYFYSNMAMISNSVHRAYGVSVRCIKD